MKPASRNIGKVLSINTSVPTFEGVPEGDVTANTVEVRTKTAVWWPDNWHLLSAQWRAILLALLVKRVITSVLSGSSPKKRDETIAEFVKLTGWGTGESK